MSADDLFPESAGSNAMIAMVLRREYMPLFRIFRRAACLHKRHSNLTLSS